MLLPQAFDDPEMGIPKFLYGSHYSSGGITLFYLVRLEPYTKLAIELQVLSPRTLSPFYIENTSVHRKGV